MLRQFLVGGFVSLCNIAVHAMITSVLIQAMRTTREPQKWPQLFLIAVMIAAVGVLMIAHMSEVLIWALAYQWVGAAPDGAKLIYFAFVNYTTLGYGDVVPVAKWQLLGPMTAMNGVLLFGWSTAVLFEVLRKAIARSFSNPPS